MYLVLTLFCIGYCVAASPDASTSTDRNGYWIHLDPVSDKHINDSFVISGTTNIPAGKPVRILIYNTVFGSMKNPPPKWQREYSIAILKGTGENNTFSTPLIEMTRSRVVDGRLEELFVGEEYCVLADGENASDSTLFNIIAPETSPSAVPTPVVPDDGHPSTLVSITPPQKSSTSPILGMISLGFVGISFAFFKR